MNDDISNFTKTASKYAVLTKIEERALLKKAQDGDKLARK